MASETRYFCDSCRSVITESRSHLRIECGDLRDRLGLETVDLCRECGERFAELVTKRPVATVSSGVGM